MFRAETGAGEACALKLAPPATAPGRSPDAAGELAPTPVNAVGASVVPAPRTEVLTRLSGTLMAAAPDTRALLAVQAGRLRSMRDRAVIRVHDDGRCRHVPSGRTFGYLQMPWIEGDDLRLAVARGGDPVRLIREVADALVRLEARDRGSYHGDLKPQNIFASHDGVTLIDPGYFGPLAGADGPRFEACVTTPLYYPRLVPDDGFALGILLWELVVGHHPLASGPGSIEVAEHDRFGDELGSWVLAHERLGNYHLSPLLGLRRPRRLRFDLPAAVEEVLLAAIGLKLRADGRLDRGTGLAGVAELGDALAALLARAR